MVSYTSAWSTVQRQAVIIINNVIIITTLKTQKETKDKYLCIVNVELNNIRSIKHEFKSEWESKVLV
jgi:alpha-N-acetylglucosamine transferase